MQINFISNNYLYIAPEDGMALKHAFSQKWG
jgi:hypothetical protein